MKKKTQRYTEDSIIISLIPLKISQQDVFNNTKKYNE